LAQVRACFQREARAIAALNHPHICAIHRLNAFIVPGGREQASFREPQTAQLLRTRVAEVLGPARQ